MRDQIAFRLPAEREGGEIDARADHAEDEGGADRVAEPDALLLPGDRLSHRAPDPRGADHGVKEHQSEPGEPHDPRPVRQRPPERDARPGSRLRLQRGGEHGVERPVHGGKAACNGGDGARGKDALRDRLRARDQTERALKGEREDQPHPDERPQDPADPLRRARQQQAQQDRGEDQIPRRDADIDKREKQFLHFILPAGSGGSSPRSPG